MEIHLPNGWTPRSYQRPLWEALEGGCKRAVAVWHRRAGKDLTAINYCAVASQKRVGLYWHVLPNYNHGRKVVWNGMTRDGRRFLDAFPGWRNPGPDGFVTRIRDDEMRLWLANESQYQVVGGDDPDALVGPNPIGVIFSEYQLQNPRCWDLIRPILVENGGWALFIYTPRGRNHGYTRYKLADKNDGWFCELLTAGDTAKMSEASGEPVPVTPEDIEAERNDGMAEELIQQEFFCVPAGTPIFTAEGQVPVEAIRPGDRVLTHTGRWRSVTDVMSRLTDEGLVEITTYGNREKLRLTPQHELRVLDPNTQTYQWVPAADIKVGHWCVQPRLKPAKPVVPEALARISAWYVAEGSCAKNSVQWSLGKHEVAYAQEIASACLDLGFEATYSSAPTSLNVIVCSTALADLLANRCGVGSMRKRIPWEFAHGHEEVFLDCLLRGDGCEIENGWFYTTVSESLAYDVQLLASACGRGSGIGWRRGGRTFIEDREVYAKDSYAVRISRTSSQKIRAAKHGIGVRVRHVRHIPYTSRVYNLAVQFDESYVAAGRVVHNCSFDAPLEGSYYGEVMTRLDKQNQIGRIPHEPGKPVITAWDLGVGDVNAIVFAQRVSHEIRIIDYYENHSVGLDHYVKVLREKPYVYGEHLAPHDIKQREYGSGGRSRLEIAKDLGVQFRVVRKLPIDDGIQATRALLPKCWFNEATTETLIQALREYTKEKDPITQQFRDRPKRDWTTHPCDAIRTLAVGLRPERDRRPQRLAPELAIV